ncbi:MAG: hypothetical protein F4243_07250 [Chloroflexi bacterium]|nr:hypothetical protein [Chloroflexota bacterium]
MIRWLLALGMLLLGFVASGQAGPRNYAITPPRVSYSEGLGHAIVSFTVSNRGAAGVDATEIVITRHESGQTSYTEELPALAEGEARDFDICLPLENLPAEDVFFRISAGIDEYELAGSRIARDNEQHFSINKAQSLAGSGVCAGSGVASTEPFTLSIPLLGWRVSFLADGIKVNGGQLDYAAALLALLVILAALAFCLWLLSLALRLLFRQPPKFEPWQPPYAHNTWYDMNSTLGRRQSWQYHAQSNLLGEATAPDQLVLVKHLLGSQQEIMGGWRVKAMRSIQYDIYGRISRTEVLMPRGVIDKLNRLLERAPSQGEASLRKAIEPLAKRISRVTLAPIEKQNLPLPIALEVRFEGANGEARILFELYQHRGEDWQLLDAWEPDLGQTGARIPEQFNFTLNGQLPGEAAHEYKLRLRADVAALLLRMLSQLPADTQEAIESGQSHQNEALQKGQRPKLLPPSTPRGK